jgi:hypothetical protein
MGISHKGGINSPTWFSRIPKAAGILLAGGLFVLLVLQALAATCEGDGNDPASYLQSADALWHGDNPFATDSPFPYIYPLFLALVITPLAILPCPAAALIWAFTGLATLVGTLAIIRRQARAQLPSVLLLGLCFVYFDVIQNNFVNGQINFLVLFLCTLGFDFSRRNRDFPAALAIGTAAAIKLTPLIMLCYLAARRRWFALGGTVLVFLLLCLIPGVVPGVELRTLYEQYVREFLVGKLVGGTLPPGQVDFSLAGILASAGLPLNSGAMIVLFLLIPGIIMFWDVRALSPENTTGRSLHHLSAYSLYMMAPLFMVPLSEVHHLVVALPAYACLVALVVLSGGRWSWILPAASLAAYLAGALFWRQGPLYFVALALLFTGVMQARQRDGEVRFFWQ